nr:MAG TPA: hypothetical protein [Caudoviricetes sp.]
MIGGKKPIPNPFYYPLVNSTGPTLILGVVIIVVSTIPQP